MDAFLEIFIPPTSVLKKFTDKCTKSVISASGENWLGVLKHTSCWLTDQVLFKHILTLKRQTKIAADDTLIFFISSAVFKKKRRGIVIALA